MTHPTSLTLVDGPITDVPRDATPGAGAVLTFEGLVRPLEDGKPITGLQYEAYDAMVIKSFDALARETIARFGLLSLRAFHSRGFVPSGARSFVLIIAGKHRKESLAAADYFIDAMKQDVPIWKAPVFEAQP